MLARQALFRQPSGQIHQVVDLLQGVLILVGRGVCVWGKHSSPYKGSKQSGVPSGSLPWPVRVIKEWKASSFLRPICLQ